MIVPSWLRHCAAMIVMTGVLGVAVGCKQSGSSNGSVTLSGTVSFTRLPVTYSDGGVGPSGPTVARGVLVRVFQLYYDLDQAGQQHQNWRLAGTVATDSNGYYSLGGNVFPGYPTFVEVESVFQQNGGHGSVVQIIADPDGIHSALAEPKRPIYVFRVGMDGLPLNTLATSVIDADNSQPPTHPIPTLNGDGSLNVSVGISDNWLVTLPNWYVPGSVASPSLTQQQAPPTESKALGGAPLAILDNAYIFSYYYGDPTPSQVAGGVLDLHYYPGKEAGRSYVVYDTRRTPLSYDGTKTHYFGSVAAGPTFDDAMDQRVIYPVLARNFLYGQAKTALFPTGASSLPSLAPDLAVVDGLGDAMAAILSGSPLLTDTSAAAPYVTRDISAIPALLPSSALLPTPGIASPANLAAVAWNLSLRASGIAAPGSPAQWATIDPSVMARFYNLIYPTTTFQADGGDVTVQTDITSIYAQVGRLLEGKQSAEPVDLRARFDNLILIGQLDPFGILWPADATLPGAVDWPFLAADWNPNRVTPGPETAGGTITLSMANARLFTDPFTGTPVYPNNSQGEVAYAKVAVFNDLEYQLNVTTNADPLPAGTSVEVVVDGHIAPPYLFSAGSSPVKLTLKGNPRDYSNPLWHFIRIRLIHPADQLSPDLLATVTLTRTHNP